MSAPRVQVNSNEWLTTTPIRESEMQKNRSQKAPRVTFAEVTALVRVVRAAGEKVPTADLEALANAAWIPAICRAEIEVEANAFREFEAMGGERL